MAKKIVLFLSMLNPHNTEADYQCPNGAWIHVRGDWSNEAPLRYLLQKRFGVSEVISITTNQAKEQTWPRLEALMAEYPDVRLTSIDYGERKLFSDPPLADVLNCFEKGDKILMDITGGPRDAVIYLLLLSQALNYMGVSRSTSVYSSFEDKRVENAEPMLGLFELLEGVKEFASSGRIETLSKYYDALPTAKRDSRFGKLLNRARQLSDALCLCQTSMLTRQLEEFRKALSSAKDCEDPLLRKLVAVLEEKFGGDMAETGLIRWCIENGMLQQAITIYTEWVPKMIFDKYLNVDMRAAVAELKNPPETRESLCATLLMAQVYKMAYKQKAYHLINEDAEAYMNGFKEYVQTHIPEFLENRAAFVHDDCPRESFWAVLKLLRLRKAFFPVPGGSKNPDWENWLRPEDSYLADFGKKFESVHTEEEFYECILNWDYSTLLHLYPNGKGFDNRTTTIEHLSELLNDQEIYQLKDPALKEELVHVLRDYLYVKYIRNLSNHAGVQETMQVGAEDSFIGKYFKEHEYSCPLYKAPAEQIRLILLRSLRRLDGQQEIY